MSDSWVRKMGLRRDVLGDLAPGSPPGKPRKLTTDDVVELCLLVDEQPDATLDELAVLMANPSNRRLACRAPNPSSSCSRRGHVTRLGWPHVQGARRELQPVH